MSHKIVPRVVGLITVLLLLSAAAFAWFVTTP
jgi:hypothetical protein